MTTRVFVGNLAFRATDQDLQSFFAGHGQIVSGVIITRGRRSLGYGFAEFVNKEEAEAAVAKLDQTTFFDRPVSVQLAKDPSEQRPPRTSTEQGEDTGEPAPRRQIRNKGRRGRQSPNNEFTENGDPVADESDQNLQQDAPQQPRRRKGPRRNNQNLNPGNPNFNPGNQNFNQGNQNFNPGNQNFNPGNPNFNPGTQNFNSGNHNFNTGNQNFNQNQGNQNFNQNYNQGRTVARNQNQGNQNRNQNRQFQNQGNQFQNQGNFQNGNQFQNQGNQFQSNQFQTQNFSNQGNQNGDGSFNPNRKNRKRRNRNKNNKNNNINQNSDNFQQNEEVVQNDQFNNGPRKPKRRVRRPPPQGERVFSKTVLYVGNLPFSIDSDGLLRLFEGSEPKSSRVCTFFSGKSRGYGFVEFENEEKQLAALNSKKDLKVVGQDGQERTLVVSVSSSFVARESSNEQGEQQQQNEHSQPSEHQHQ